MGRRSMGTRWRTVASELPAAKILAVEESLTCKQPVVKGSGAMSRLKIKPRKFKAKSADIPNLADAVFAGDDEMPGWVIMAVNKKGQECVEALFPEAHIAWRDAGPGFPADWQGFKINLPNVVAHAGPNKLPDITGGANLDEASPEALAFLLAAGVKHQGGRPALLRNGRLEIFRTHAGN
jgi:hypothetical protein